MVGVGAHGENDGWTNDDWEKDVVPELYSKEIKFENLEFKRMACDIDICFVKNKCEIGNYKPNN